MKKSNFLLESDNNFYECCYEFNPNTPYTYEHFNNNNLYFENDYDLSPDFNNRNLIQNYNKNFIKNNESAIGFQRDMINPNLP